METGDKDGDGILRMGIGKRGDGREWDCEWEGGGDWSGGL